jgi:hypothetical protein
MKLHGRIPVEKLDDERLTNIERRVVAAAAERLAKPDRARRPFALIAAVGAAAIAAVVGWKLHAPEAVSPVATTTTDSPLAIRTNATGSTIDIGDATIDSGPETAFVVTRPAGGVLVEMTRGKVSLSVGKRHDRPPLVVRAGATDVVVVGTKFTVDYGDGTHDVDVRVTEGVVRVVADKLETRVAAGDHWHTDRGIVVATAEPVAPVTPPPPDVHLRDHAVAVPVAPHVDPVVRRPVVATPPPPRPHDALVAASDPHRDLKAEIISQRVEPAMDIGVKDITEAMSRYRIIVLGEKGDAAATALYSMAVTQHLKLGRDGDALRSIDAYAVAYPAGHEIRAALWLRVRILCRVAIDDQCKQAAVQYRRVAGDAPAARVADRITSHE